MEKIKFIADTACDIPDEDLQEYHIDLPSVPIVVDGEEYWERRSFSISEFYKVLESSKEIPVTSRVPVSDFYECYTRAMDEGYTDIICVTINAGGSGTNASAHTARDQLYSQLPEAADKIRIHIIDSKTYAAAYGYPVILSARMAREGKSVAEILEFLDDWFSRVEVLLGCYSLEYAKKSGRIGAAAAFVGDVLGLRPVIAMIGGGTKTLSKTRGDSKLVDQIIDTAIQREWDLTSNIAVVCGSELKYGEEMRDKLKKKFGIDAPIYPAGASIVINSGPKIAAIVYLGKKRHPSQKI